MRRVRFLVPVIALALVAAGCSAASSIGSAPVAPSSTGSVALLTPGPTAIPSVAPTVTPSPTPSPKPAATPLAKPSPAPTARPTKAPPVATSRRVSVANFSFGPATLGIQVGAKVTWTNHDMTDHTVTGAFGSGSLAPGATFSHTFRTAGTFRYHCSIHPYMTGTVTVR